MTEPRIRVGDFVLTDAQSMAVRVAITDFHSQMFDPALRKELGENLTDAYRDRLSEVLAFIAVDGGFASPEVRLKVVNLTGPPKT